PTKCRNSPCRRAPGRPRSLWETGRSSAARWRPASTSTASNWRRLAGGPARAASKRVSDLGSELRRQRRFFRPPAALLSIRRFKSLATTPATTTAVSAAARYFLLLASLVALAA